MCVCVHKPFPPWYSLYPFLPPLYPSLPPLCLNLPQPDYCNIVPNACPVPSLLAYAPKFDSSISGICLLHKFDHVTRLLKIFQLLPIAFTVKTKLADMIYTRTSMTCPLSVLSGLFLTIPHSASYSFFQLPGGTRSFPDFCYCSTHL